MKQMEALKKISTVLAPQVPYLVIQDGALRVITDKAIVTIKKNGVCILKTNGNNAMQILKNNQNSKVRKIWDGQIVSECGSKYANDIASDILKL